MNRCTTHDHVKLDVVFVDELTDGFVYESGVRLLFTLEFILEVLTRSGREELCHQSEVRSANAQGLVELRRLWNVEWGTN